MDLQIESLKFDAAGLVAAIIQDHVSGQVLVMCYMNREAIEKTLESGKVHVFSRSRKRVALKGETSGHFQLVRRVLCDCDRDALVFQVEQISGACHEGYLSCFFREYQKGAREWKTVGEKVFEPDAVYKK